MPHDVKFRIHLTSYVLESRLQIEDNCKSVRLKFAYNASRKDFIAEDVIYGYFNVALKVCIYFLEKLLFTTKKQKRVTFVKMFCDSGDTNEIIYN